MRIQVRGGAPGRGGIGHPCHARWLSGGIDRANGIAANFLSRPGQVALETGIVVVIPCLTWVACPPAPLALNAPYGTEHACERPVPSSPCSCCSWASTAGLHSGGIHAMHFWCHQLSLTVRRARDLPPDFGVMMLGGIALLGALGMPTFHVNVWSWA